MYSNRWIPAAASLKIHHRPSTRLNQRLHPQHTVHNRSNNAMPFTPRPAKPYTPMLGLSAFEIQSAERLRTHILHLAREQSIRPSWHRPHANGKFYVKHFRQAGGSAYIARAIAYPPSSDGGYDDYCIVLGTGASKEGVHAALERLGEVFERRGRVYKGEIEELLGRARIGD